ncbi:hypothetical protein [Stieleria varia]|nr:hypothetical protein [Stieleria varia]
MHQNAQRQRLAMLRREQQALPTRLARAEALREARAMRAAQRLRQQGRSSTDYMLTSIEVD